MGHSAGSSATKVQMLLFYIATLVREHCGATFKNSIIVIIILILRQHTSDRIVVSISTSEHVISTDSYDKANEPICDPTQRKTLILAHCIFGWDAFHE